jgi:hypothetical protein
MQVWHLIFFLVLWELAHSLRCNFDMYIQIWADHGVTYPFTPACGLLLAPTYHQLFDKYWWSLYDPGVSYLGTHIASETNADTGSTLFRMEHLSYTTSLLRLNNTSKITAKIIPESRFRINNINAPSPGITSSVFRLTCADFMFDSLCLPPNRVFSVFSCVFEILRSWSNSTRPVKCFTVESFKARQPLAWCVSYVSPQPPPVLPTTVE